MINVCMRAIFLGKNINYQHLLLLFFKFNIFAAD